MTKMLPKKLLDETILKELVKYYKIKPEVLEKNSPIEWECFSHPSLELHECNTRSRLPGGHSCKHCKHVVGVPCPISCDLQAFCLAVFAWRLGIGGEEFETALHNNLYKLNQDELFNCVIEVFSLPEGAKTAQLVAEETATLSKDPEEDTMTKKTKESAVEGMLDIKEAAELYGCTYANIYNCCKSGVLAFTKQGRRMFVTREDVLALRDRPRSKKKDAVEVEG